MSELAQRFVAGRKGSQVSGVLLTALGTFLLVSLVSYSHFDPPNSSQFHSDTINWAGKVGAHVSYGLFAAVGLSAYTLPLLVLLWGWNRLRRREVRADAMRTAGLLGIATFFSIASGLPTWSSYTAFELGGWLGTWTTNVFLVPYTGRVGSMILLSALLLASLLLVTDLDPRRLLTLIAAGGTQVSAAATRAFASIRVFTAKLAAVGRRNDPEDSEPEEDDDEEDEDEGFEGGDSVADDEVRSETLTPPKRLPTIRKDEIQVRRPPVADAGPVKPPASVPSPTQDEGMPKESGESAGSGKLRKKGGRYKVPVVTLLDPVPNDRGEPDRESLLANARILEEAMANFDVMGKVVEISPGPVVTRYEVEPAPGVKVGRISALADDLARVMSAQGIRIQAPVPGKSVVGVEIANHHRETVYLREIIDSPAFKNSESLITMALGKTIAGEDFVTDMAKMPHLLVAGATGAGKSVCINGLICSILLRATPDQVRLLMIDPKVV